MSRLQQLIIDLCPKGVEYAALGETCQKTYNISWDDSHEQEFRYIDLTSVNRITHVIEETEVINSQNAPSRAQKIVKTGDIIFGTTRPTLKRYCFIPKEYDNQICSTGYCVLRANRSIVLPRYIFHHMGSNRFLLYVEANQRGSTYPAISDSDIKKFSLPIPPLPIQQEIVRILDTFTALEAELEAELEKRKAQYEYYRKKYLSDLTSNGTKMKPLGEFCDLLTGYPFDSSQFSKEGIRLLRGMNVKRGLLDFTEPNNRYWFNKDGFEKFFMAKDDIVIAMDGSLVGKSFGIVEQLQLPLLLVQRVARIRAVKDNPHYIYHCIACGAFTDYVEKNKTAGAVPHISLKDISNFMIPVPSVKVQNEIASILDRFDALVNDITQGLPAEIAARRKQYEYYRDKLLTFKRKEAAV